MSEATRVAKGDVIPYSPDSDSDAGDVFVVNGIVGVLVSDTDSGVEGALSVEGVYEFPTSDNTIKQGEACYWSGSTAAASGSDEIGPATEDAANDTVKIKLSN